MKKNLYSTLQEAITKYAKSKGEYDSRLAALKELYKDKEGYTGEDADAKIEQELVADLAGDYLFTDKAFVENLYVGDRGLFQKIFDEVKYLCKVVTAGSKEARQLEKVKKTFQEVYRAETKNPTADGGAKYSLNIKHTDGSVEVLADARNLTTEQAVSYLQQAKAGTLRRDTYIPVRKDTPQVIIDTLEQVNEHVENCSLVMQVDKAQQSMKTEKTERRVAKYGSNVRGHALSAEQIVEILNKLDDPSMIVYQTNRHDVAGNLLPNNVVVIVEYSSNETEGVAVIEFDSSFKQEVIGREFGDVNYHTVVTVFEPDVMRDDMEFDYAEELLSNPDNIELKIERRQPKGSATGANQPNTSNELPYSDSIRNPNGEVNTKNSLSDPNADIAPPIPSRNDIHGKDIALGDVPIRSDIQQKKQSNDADLGNVPIREDLRQTEFDGDGIRDQLRSNQDTLNTMHPVAEIQVSEDYAQLDVAGKKNWVVEKLRQTGYKVMRKGFGVIEFAKKRLKSAFNYFDKGSVEEAAFEALPYVLENGVEISSHAQHKGRDYGTVTIAAPITINGKRGYMAVVVKQTTGNYYKVHRILTPDGSVFVLPEMQNEAESTPTGESPKNGSLATSKDPASNISIPNVGKNVKSYDIAPPVPDIAPPIPDSALRKPDGKQRKWELYIKNDRMLRHPVVFGRGNR